MNAVKVVSAVLTTTSVFRSKDQHDARCGLVDKVISIAAAWDLLEVDNRDWAVISGSNSILYLCTVYSEPGTWGALLVGRYRDQFPVVSLDFPVTYSFRPYHGP